MADSNGGNNSNKGMIILVVIAIVFVFGIIGSCSNSSTPTKHYNSPAEEVGDYMNNAMKYYDSIGK